MLRHLPETNSLSSCMLFVPFIQNVINLGFATEEMNKEILTLLMHLKSLPKFKGLEHEVKIQNLLMLLVSKNAISLNSIDSTFAIFNVLMALSNQNQKMLWNKTLSIAVQMSLLLLN